MANAPTAVSQHAADGKILEGKRVLITGGTGSLGKVLLRRILGGDAGRPTQIIVLSRDEAKQHQIRVEYQQRYAATDEVIYKNFRDTLSFRIGDVRDYASVCAALHGIDIVFNAAALKQVPTCEYFPYEAVLTNITGPENIVRAIRDLQLPVEVVVGISTDKAVKPVNVMGMTKSIQERIFARANLELPHTRIRHRPLRQRAGVARLGHPVVPRADQDRRTGHDHASGHDAIPAQPGRSGRPHLRGGARCAARRDLHPARAGRAHGRRRRRADRRPSDQDGRHRNPAGREAARDPDLGGRGASHGAARPAIRDRSDPAGAASRRVRRSACSIANTHRPTICCRATASSTCCGAGA